MLTLSFMKKQILLTRPRTASERFGLRLMQSGFAYKIDPLLTISPTRNKRPAGDLQAVMVTSANALDALAEQGNEIHDLLELPCFCVGEATGLQAQSLGFRHIHCGSSDSVELSRFIAPSFKDKSVLHIASDITDNKARDFLSVHSVTLIPWIVYKAIAAEDFMPETHALFTSQNIAAIPVFSPRTAHILVSLIEKNGFSHACKSISAIALSQAVADVLQTLPWQSLAVASNPSEDKILSCLQTELP